MVKAKTRTCKGTPLEGSKIESRPVETCISLSRSQPTLAHWREPNRQLEQFNREDLNYLRN